METSWISLRRLTARTLQCAFCALVALTAHAQTAPGNEQLQMFQGLTPEQQQAVLQQMGGSGDVVDDSTRQPQESRPQAAASRQQRSSKSADLALSDVLAPDDVVVVELALPGTMPKLVVRSGVVVDPNGETAPRRVRSPPREELTEKEEGRLVDIIAAVARRNPYQLDRNGQLLLPGFAPIRLGGLSETQAVQRLSVEPELLQLDVSLSRLPVSKVGVEGLKPYGYDMFDSDAAGYSQRSYAPVPTDYIVGPGDEFVVLLYGNQIRERRLFVSREGVLRSPELGPITVGGLTVSAARARIESLVSQQMIGVRVSVSMGEIRSFGIQVTGEVRKSGNYTVSGLDTVISALYSSGGITSIGSMRNIQLKRRGAVVGNLDLYEVRLRGNDAGDLRLQPGDVVFVPTVGPTVKVDGEVKRPAIYELRGGESAAAVLELAGGLQTEADPTRSSVTRIDDQYQHVVLNIDFSRAESRNQLLRGGDELRVARLRPQIDAGVMLEGFVHRPGLVEWREGLRLSDVIGSIDELKPRADPNYVLVRRETGVDRHVEVFGPDLVAALARRGGPADMILASRDVITVFELAPGRERIIRPLLADLQLQAGADRPIQIVRVDGRVKAPGDYPLESGMTVSDLLRAGGGLDAAAYRGTAELARSVIDGNGVRQPTLVEINLAAVLAGDTAADIPLQTMDSLQIKETPDWASQLSVTLRGEVRFPGPYTISRGETLFDVIQRAGGLTPRAFARGSVFTRLSLQEREQKQLDQLTERTQVEVATMSLRAAAANQQGADQTLSVGRSLLADIKGTRAVGRLVINLQGLLDEGKASEKNVLLRDGDVLMVPSQAQEVTVIGEVQTVTSHLYNSSLGRDDYLSKSGGTTRQADLRKIYVVRADGSVLAPKGGLLKRSYSVAIQPGDTIVVPLNTERLPRLPFWQAVTQIVYNLAISVAAVSSF